MTTCLGEASFRTADSLLVGFASFFCPKIAANADSAVYERCFDDPASEPDPEEATANEELGNTARGELQALDLPEPPESEN